jgi:hypothetical protein
MEDVLKDLWVPMSKSLHKTLDENKVANKILRLRKRLEAAISYIDFLEKELKEIKKD